MMPAMGLGTGGYGGAAGGGEWWNDTMVPPIITEWLKRGGRRIDTAYVDCHVVDLGVLAYVLAHSLLPLHGKCRLSALAYFTLSYHWQCRLSNCMEPPNACMKWNDSLRLCMY